MMVDDENLFRSSMSDVIPLNSEQVTNSFSPQFNQAQKLRLVQTQRRQLLENLTVNFNDIEPVEPEGTISYCREGVQHSVFKLFKQGRYPNQASLDLRGLNIEQAREALVNYITACIKQNLRNVLVIHGTGIHNKPFPALIKSFLAQWLKNIEEVSAYHSATKVRGGSGALSLMLIKSEDAKIEAREQNRRGASR